MTSDLKSETLNDLYGSMQLHEDRERALISIERLPSWPNPKAHEFGHGIGPILNRALGGGLRAGTIIGVAAASAKAGKTAFIHQIADGLALRTAQLIYDETPRDKEGHALTGAALEIAMELRGKPAPLTPVLLLSELDVAGLSWRSLARWTGYPANHFRAGQSAEKWPEYKEEMWAAADDAMSVGRFAESRILTRYMRTTAGGLALVEELRREVAAMRTSNQGREVWPVIVIDPIQRRAGGEKNATEAESEFANGLNDAAREDGWIVLLTSDATKGTATGSGKDKDQSPAEEGAAAFRGSYVLQHILDAALYLRPNRDVPEAIDGAREIDCVPVFNRWGAGGGYPIPFEFQPRTMRFIAQEEVAQQKAQPPTGKQATVTTLAPRNKYSNPLP